MLKQNNDIRKVFTIRTVYKLTLALIFNQRPIHVELNYAWQPFILEPQRVLEALVECGHQGVFGYSLL